MKNLVILLVVMLLGGVFAQDTADTAVDPVVLRVGEAEETLSTFERRFEIAIRSLAAAQGVELNEGLRAQLEGFKPQFLDRRGTELVLLQESVARSIELDETELEAQLESIIANLPEGMDMATFLAGSGFEDEAQFRAYVSEGQVLQATVDSLQNEIEITDEQIATAYEERKAEFASDEEICARHILLDTQEDAQAVLDDLEAGADFVELAKERSTGPSGPNGGDLNCYGRGMMVPPFDEASFAADLDTPVGPVETQFGFHVILVYDKTEAVVQALEDVSEQLEESLKGEQLSLVMQALSSAANIETFPENLVAVVEESEPESTEGSSDEDSGDESSSDEAASDEDNSEDEEGEGDSDGQ